MGFTRPLCPVCCLIWGVFQLTLQVEQIMEKPICINGGLVT